jgi:hypothetical protein
MIRMISRVVANPRERRKVGFAASCLRAVPLPSPSGQCDRMGQVAKTDGNDRPSLDDKQALWLSSQQFIVKLIQKLP